MAHGWSVEDSLQQGASPPGLPGSGMNGTKDFQCQAQVRSPRSKNCNAVYFGEGAARGAEVCDCGWTSPSPRQKSTPSAVQVTATSAQETKLAPPVLQSSVIKAQGRTDDLSLSCVQPQPPRPGARPSAVVDGPTLLISTGVFCLTQQTSHLCSGTVSFQRKHFPP